jgi:hypothetical protein
MTEWYWSCILILFSAVLIGIVSFHSFCFADNGASGVQENLPSGFVSKTNVSVFIKTTPSSMTSDPTQPKEINIRFFDATGKENLKNVSFFLNVTRNGDQRLMYDFFYTKNGYFNLKFLPGGNEGQWKVLGDKEPTLGGWYSQTGNVTVLSAIFTEPGMYLIHVQMLSMAQNNELFPAGLRPEFLSSFLVADISNHTITYHGVPYNVTTFSYYNKIDKFNFDFTKLQFSWSMPFDWNIARIVNQPFLVHEDIYIPKTLKEFTNATTYSETVNEESIIGIPHVIVDPYSSTNATIYHFLISKYEIQRLSAAILSGTNTMNFTLVANQNTTVPEFSSLSGMVIAVSIFGIVIMSLRFRFHF